MADRSVLAFAGKLFVVALLIFFGVIYGFFATVNHWFIADQINAVRKAFETVYEDLQRPWFMAAPAGEVAIDVRDADALAPGLVMLAGVGPERRNFIKVIERDGTEVYSWAPDWFEIWPDPPATLPKDRVPNRQPGATLHGVHIMDNGDVLMNYELLSTVRLSACGDVQWKLDNLGHHSIDRASDGTFWVGSEIPYLTTNGGYENHVPAFNSWTLQNITADGEILKSIEVLDILRKNDLLGLMYLSTLNNTETLVTFDTLHLNDIEEFPPDLQSDIFEPGDLMLSLRNINTIIVVDPVDFKVKFKSTGAVLRQHDPDFRAENKIIVFDNRNLEPGGLDPHSRIVEIDAISGDHRVLFRGQGDAHYYSNTMGRVQGLENGNLMIASTLEGRAIEVAPDGRLLWQYFNNLGDGYAGLLPEAHVLPQFMDRPFFERLSAACTN